MKAKVREVLNEAREMLKNNIDMIDTENDCLGVIEMRVTDTVNAFHSYIDCIWCLHELGEISDEDADTMTRKAYMWFKGEGKYDFG